MSDAKKRVRLSTAKNPAKQRIQIRITGMKGKEQVGKGCSFSVANITKTEFVRRFREFLDSLTDADSSD